MEGLVRRHPKWMQGAIAESRRLELKIADHVECAIRGLAEASSGLRKLFGGVRSEIDQRLDALDATIAALRPKLNATELDRESFAPHQEMLLNVFAELQSTIGGLACEAAVRFGVDRLKQLQSPGTLCAK